MKVPITGVHTTVGARRGDAVVCIPVHGTHQYFVECLQSVLAHTPEDTPILVCDDTTSGSRARDLVAQLDVVGDYELTYIALSDLNGAFAAAAPGDVVLLNSDCVVTEGWLTGLRDAAYSDSRVATATSLTNNGSMVCVPGLAWAPELPEGWTVDRVAAAIRANSMALRPSLPGGIGHCVYIRRTALELVGDFDLAFSRYGQELDFSQRCIRAGLAHVLADDVFVLQHEVHGRSTNGVTEPHQECETLASRYPYYRDLVRAVERDRTGALSRARGAARRAVTGMSVLIDARTLTGSVTGTQVQTLEVMLALARTGKVRLKALVPNQLSEYAEQALATEQSIELVTLDDLRISGRAGRSAVSSRAAGDVGDGDGDGLECVDIVHRPFQVQTAADVAMLSSLGDRLVITNQDLIGYHNPAYFRDYKDLLGYRHLTRVALALADHVVFVSEHGRDEALDADLVEAHRASVVHNGVDHATGRSAVHPTPPTGAAKLPHDAEVILCIGTDFWHKNRLFALRLVEQLRRRHAWDGYLVFVGPRVALGSSTAEEAELIAHTPGLAANVLDFKAVSEAEKAWMFQRTRLVVYPTVHEGFGLIPFEAAEHGIPCLWAHGTAMSELLEESVAGIVPWSAEESADRAFALLHDDVARVLNISSITDAAAGLTWDAAASKLIEIYESVCAAPPTTANVLKRLDGVLANQMSADAMRLIGPGGALPADLERPLLALATHPRMSAPLFGAIKLGYQMSYALRRGAQRRRRRSQV